MSTYLYTIAKDILLHEKNGISKVRFAKTLYFIHKELVRENKITSEELSFIRMPLGPVPYGFMDLHLRKHIRTYISNNETLSYNTQIYAIKDSKEVNPSDFYQTVERVLKELNSFPTSQLVELSHADPSWIQKRNGEQYEVTIEDLKVSLPKINTTKLSTEIDEQRLQASLVSGMIDDIVEESTNLEYPQV